MPNRKRFARKIQSQHFNNPLGFIEPSVTQICSFFRIFAKYLEKDIIE